MDAELPELLQLLTELSEKVGEANDHVSLLRDEASQLDTERGVSLLELKNHVLLSYVCNLSQLLLLKTEGKSIAESPAVLRLAELRTVVEKVRPLDQKLSYQVDKLIRASLMDSPADAAAANDPLMFRPNPANLMPKVGESEDDEGGEGGARVYVPPRLKAVHYEESSSQRKKPRKLDSSILHELRSEFTDAPEEVHDIGSRKRRVEQEDRERFEEEHMVRLSGSRAGAKKSGRISASLEDIVPFADAAERRHRSGKKKRKWGKSKGRKKAKQQF